MLHGLVGKDVCVQLPHAPGYRRFVHVRRAFGYAPPLPETYDPTSLTLGAALGLVVSDFDEYGQPLPEHLSAFLVVFDCQGKAIARVTPVHYYE